MSFEVVFDRNQEVFHCWQVHNFEGILSREAYQRHHSGVGGSNVAHDVRRTSETTFFGVMALCKVRNAPLLHIQVDSQIWLRCQIKRLRIPKEKPRLTCILTHHTPWKLHH